MKNTLLTTSALVMTAGSAFAADNAVNVKVGGFFNSTVAISSVDADVAVPGSDFDGIDVHTNAEIIFKPSLTLDNGIKIGAEVQYKMTVNAPSVSAVGAHSSSLTAFVPYGGFGNDIFRGTLGTVNVENLGNNDANRLTYFTPRFGGLQFGVSYANDAGQGNGAVNTNAAGTVSDIFDLGLNYGGSFGGVDIDASARWGTASVAGGEDATIYGAGLKFGFSGFSIGASFAEQDDSVNSDGTAYDVGIGYASGPMSYSLTYFSGENVDNDNVAFDETLDTIILAAKYKVHKNFSVSAFIANTDFEEEAAGGNEVDGTVLGVSAHFSF